MQFFSNGIVVFIARTAGLRLSLHMPLITGFAPEWNTRTDVPTLIVAEEIESTQEKERPGQFIYKLTQQLSNLKGILNILTAK